MNTFDLIISHRSIRKYKSDPIEDETLNRILEAASRASSSGNMQTYSIIITKSYKKRKKLWELHYKQDMVIQAPVLLTFCADWNRMNKWCRLRDAEPGYDNFLCFMVASADAFIAAQNATLAAEYFGLGICYMGTTLNNVQKISDFLKCPDDVIPVTTLVMGYPDEQPQTKKRLPLYGILHEEEYKDYDSDSIDRIYEKRDSEGWNRYMSHPEFAEKMMSSGVKNLAHIYTKLKYTKKENIASSKELLSLVKSKGFMNH